MGQDSDEILARLSPSPGRRAIGCGMFVVLGGTLLWTALAHPPASLIWLVFLLFAGAVSLYGAHAMWRATAQDLVLTRDRLFEADGRLIACVEDIEAVDRGMFAFKPSNGFLIRLSTAAPRAWAPGLWWRMGRRVGVGGVTPGGQGRAMADILTGVLAERDR